MILAGDGSGSGWGLPIGWACTLIERASGGRKRFYGGMNDGTIAVAELVPYVQAMSWYAAHRKGKAGDLPPICRVLVVTDHQAIETEGKALASGAKSLVDVSNRCYWAALLSFERDGFAFDYKHVERATIALNCHADEVSKGARHAMKTLPMPTDLAGNVLTGYECNANDDSRTPVHALTPYVWERAGATERGTTPHDATKPKARP